jgi:hypothetical protein
MACHRSVVSDIPADLIIHVNNTKYQLHKVHSDVFLPFKCKKKVIIVFFHETLSYILSCSANQLLHGFETDMHFSSYR